MRTAFLFAATFQDADDTALLDWKWQRSSVLIAEFQRPDSGQIVRFVPDMNGTMSGFAWRTEIYLGRNWQRRHDAVLLVDLIEAGLFTIGDPELPPPRPSRGNRLERLRGELRTMLGLAT